MVLEYSQSLRDLAHEALMGARKPYTPEQLAEIPAILAAKASYFYGVDLNDRELLKDVFVTEGFDTYWGGGQGYTDPDDQIAQNLFLCDNAKMVPMHFGHNQVVNFVDDTHVQLVTRMNDYHTYCADDYNYAGFGLYVDDLVKCEDGKWRIQTLRLDYGVVLGSLRFE